MENGGLHEMSVTPQTIPEMFRQSVQRFAEVPALMAKVNGRYHSITYRQVDEMVKRFGRGLIALGVRKRDNVALLSENRPEWAVADLALAHIGAVNVAIFPNVPAGQVEYILRDSGAKVIIVSDHAQLKKVLDVREKTGDAWIISMETPPPGTGKILTFSDVLEAGESTTSSYDEFKTRAGSLRSNDWASIIYTSGTTGDPKGVVLSHGNFVSNIQSAQKVLHFEAGEVLLSFIPLNHVMGRLVDHYLPLSTGATVAYVESLLRLRQNIREVKPHYMLLVPRVLDAVRESILTALAKEPVFKQTAFKWALWFGVRCSRQVQNKGQISTASSLVWTLADRLVYLQIKTGLGLDRLKFFFSGGAPLSYSTAEFYGALKITILEGYGLTETSPLVAVNPTHRIKFGTVGLPIHGVEVKIGQDGEILVRGPNVMQGYFKRPEDTREAIDEDGWLHTGDIGSIDRDGYLTIEDRKKNLIVLSNGKKVAPQPIENRLAESPFISYAVLVGDGRPTITALLFPSLEHLTHWAEERGLKGFAERKTLGTHPEVMGLMKTEIERLLPECADYEKIRKFSIVNEELTIESGTLTPTVKVKRATVIERYRDLIEAMYR